MNYTSTQDHLEKNMLIIFMLIPLVFAGEYNQLYSNAAEASSFLKSSWNKYNENYHPNYILDGNPRTAWVEGVSGNGDGEQIVIPISAVSKVKEFTIRIRNGYQKSKSLLAANAAPKEVKIEVKNRLGQTLASQTTMLEKKMGWQDIIIPIEKDLQAQLISLTVLSTHSGSKYKDGCISDIEIHVLSDTPYNEKAELAKQASLQKWTEDRIKQAKYFATQPKEYPFASAKVFNSTSTNFSATDKDELRRKITDAQNLIETISKDNAWYTRESTNTLEYSPDGMYELPAMDIWDLSSLALFETSKQYDIYIDHGRENYSPEFDYDFGPFVEHFVSNFKVKKRADASVEFLYFTDHKLMVERSFYGDDNKVLCQYDQQGRLILLYQETIDLDEEMTWLMGEEGGSIIHSVYTFAYDSNNKIKELNIQTLQENVYANTEEMQWSLSSDGEVMEGEYSSEEEKKKLLGKKISTESIDGASYSFNEE